VAHCRREFLDRFRHDPDSFLSPVTFWEVTIKQKAGKVAGRSTWVPTLLLFERSSSNRVTYVGRGDPQQGPGR